MIALALTSCVLAQGGVFLHIESDDPRIELYRERSDALTTHKDSVCKAPCGIGVEVRPGDAFYFSALNTPTSRSFELDDYRGDVTARVRAGSLLEVYLGYAAAVLGWEAFSTGGVAMLVGTVSPDAQARRDLLIGGGIAVGAGVLLGLTAVYCILTGRTRFELLPSAPPSQKVSPGSL